jgi:hypothetical protein
MLAEALALCLIIFLMILFVFYYICSRTFWSSLGGACLIALIVLVVLYPPLLLIAERASWKTVLYCVLLFIFVFIILMYIIVAIVKDRRECHRSKCDVETNTIDYDRDEGALRTAPGGVWEHLAPVV